MTLCTDVSDWVETEFSDVYSILAVLEESATKSTTYSESIKIFLDEGLAGSWKEHETAQLSFLASIIHRFLEYNIFNRYAFGVTNNVADQLSAVEAQMARSTPSKGKSIACCTSTKLANRKVDAESIALWRSETLRFLMQAPQMLETRAKESFAVTECITGLLTPLFTSARNRDKAIGVFHNRITKVAVDLAVLLRTSPVNYNFRPQFVSGTQTEPCYVIERQIRMFKVVDVQTDRQPRKSTTYQIKAGGKIGHAVCFIYPSLKRRAWKGQSIVISKPEVLLRFNKPAPEGSQTSGLLWRFLGM